MARWEYWANILNNAMTNSELARWGSEGWELVSYQVLIIANHIHCPHVAGHSYVFKRQIHDAR